VHLYLPITLKVTAKSLATYNLPKLNHEDTENLSRPVTSDSINVVGRSLPVREAQEWMVSLLNFAGPLKNFQ
jgi:hypothetical protein